MIRAYSLHTGEDGHSHVTTGSIVDNEVLAAESILFEETPAHSSLDRHNAPTTRYGRLPPRWYALRQTS
jgi:hypothetical protein